QPDALAVARRRPQSLLRLGYNCCAIARADRVSVLIDAASYFRAFHDAALRARRSITILAWDFNSQTRLHFDPVPPDGPPAVLGEFLNYLVRRRRGLHVNVLNWDYPMVFGTDREFPPLYGFGWTPERRVHLRYDDTHPIAGCLHQKVVVIDDALAFAGGIDLTVRRWDTPEHLADDPRRTAYGKPYPPFHDLMVAVDGDAARALASLARERWLCATGRRLRDGAARGDEVWPEALEPDFTDLDIGIARTLPPRGEAPAVREVEKLYLDMIASARQALYIENQYFTAPRIAAALEKRLAEPDGPEVVLVLRLLSHGWLEEHTMHILRTRLLRRLQAADRHGRFRAYYPHVPGLASGCCLDVHAKLMIADDACLRVGSSNLCNRSMAVDAECDIAIEARGDPRVAGTIREFRDRLIAEHTGLAPEAFARRLAETGSLHKAIDSLPAQGRALVPFKDVPEWPEAIVSVAAVADPEEPIALDALMAERALEEEAVAARPAWGKLVAAILAIAALAALWRYTPVAHVVTPANVIDWAQEFASSWWAPLVVMAAYTPACFVMFPRPLITLAGVIAFGPWLGFGYAVAGVVASAVVTYYVGRAMKRDTVRRLAGRKLDRMVDVLKKHGLLAMTLLRLVPIAPFAVEGIVAGAVRLKLWQLTAGTALGMLPGTLAATVFGDQIESALTGSGGINWWVLGAVAVAFVAGIVAVRRWFNRMARRLSADAARSEPR
ncbi:MAG: VTT domain-containing protein, partial [Bacillota bacterium]